MSTKKATYEYGKGNTFTRKDGTVVEVTKLPPNTPEPGDILFYKKRDWKKRRLNEMNQWKFVCVETQGQEKGKWKVQGLHKEVGDYNWFDPHSLMRSNEVTNDLFSKDETPSVKENKKVKQNKEKKPISIDKPDGDTRKKVRELLERGMKQADIARELGFTQATISQHAVKIRKENQKSQANKVGDYPIFNYTETAEYLKIDLPTLNKLIKKHSIIPREQGNYYKFTESQIEQLTEILTQDTTKEEVTPEELGSYGVDYQEEGPTQKEHKATVEMKNYNDKRVISENLKMIKSLIHQTNELLEKIQ